MTETEKRKKPENLEELESDLENHPERGMLGGEPVVEYRLTEIRGSIPVELSKLLLETGASLGITDKSVLLQMAIADFVSARLHVVRHQHEIKANKFGVDVQTVRAKFFGTFKLIGRKKKLNLAKGEKE